MIFTAKRKRIKFTPLVQLVERRFPKPNAEGSSPSRRVLVIIVIVNDLNMNPWRKIYLFI